MAKKYEHANLRHYRAAVKVTYKNGAYSFDPGGILVWDGVLADLADYELAGTEQIGIWPPWEMALHFTKTIERTDKVEKIVYFVTRRNLFSTAHQHN